MHIALVIIIHLYTPVCLTQNQICSLYVEYTYSVLCIKTVLYHYIERINYVDLIDKFAIYVHIEKLVKIFSFMDGYNTLDIYVMYMFILGWDIEREKFLVQYGYLFSIKMFHLKCYGNFQHYTDHILYMNVYI